MMTAGSPECSRWNCVALEGISDRVIIVPGYKLKTSLSNIDRNQCARFSFINRDPATDMRLRMMEKPLPEMTAGML